MVFREIGKSVFREIAARRTRANIKGKKAMNKNQVDDLASIGSMANVIPFPSGFDREFDGCPICRRNNGLLDIGPQHWGVCHNHKVKWHYGTNIFSGWRYQDEATRAENEQLLASYTTVKPVYIARPSGGAVMPAFDVPF